MNRFTDKKGSQDTLLTNSIDLQKVRDEYKSNKKSF